MFSIFLGRRHGFPPFLKTRRLYGLNASFSKFEDLLVIFPQNYVELLESAYDDVEDIDLLVGVLLETFLVVNSEFAGETLRKIIEEQFKRSIAGDAYFYAHQSNPYPFSGSQVEAIKSVSLNNLICVNSDITSVPKIWFLVDNDSYNPLVSCSEYKQMNLSAWKNI